MKRIIWFRSGDHYNVMAADHPGMWASGATKEAAVGQLILTWASEFNVELQEAERK